MPGPACVFKEREYKLALNADESKVVCPRLKHMLLQKQHVSIKILTWQKSKKKKRQTFVLVVQVLLVKQLHDIWIL